MEKKGYVSIWLGNFPSINDLMEYADTDMYDEDGNDIPSRFAVEFFDVEKHTFDPDFFELGVCEPSDSLSELIKDFSYGAAILVDGIKLDKTYNAVILVYDFEYEPDRNPADAAVEFIAAVHYEQLYL